MTDLDLLATDLLNETAAILPAGDAGRIVGFELAGGRSRVAYFAVQDGNPPQCLTSFPATADHTDVLAAADTLAVALLNTLPELDRVVIGRAMHDGSKLRLHARPATGEVSLAILHAGHLVEIGRRVIEYRSTFH
jgi:hypothetical protein